MMLHAMKTARCPSAINANFVLSKYDMLGQVEHIISKHMSLLMCSNKVEFAALASSTVCIKNDFATASQVQYWASHQVDAKRCSLFFSFLFVAAHLPISIVECMQPAIPVLEVVHQLLHALLHQLLGVVSLSLHHLQLTVLLPVQPLQLLALL